MIPSSSGRPCRAPAFRRAPALVLVAAVAAVSAAQAQPVASPPAASWTDTPALVASATAAVDADLRSCLGRGLPHALTLVAMRARDGSTTVAMPMPAVGGRGLTPTERCLARVIARVSLPPLPPEVERVTLRHVVAADGAGAPAVEPAFAAWRDPGATLAAFLDASCRASLDGCASRARTVRLVLDLRKRATRVWLPAWQFHSPSGDGSTPVAERRVKACLARAIRGWTLPPLPRAMAELELAIAVGR